MLLVNITKDHLEVTWKAITKFYLYFKFQIFLGTHLIKIYVYIPPFYVIYPKKKINFGTKHTQKTVISKTNVKVGLSKPFIT